ncbi:site-specific integrase [Peribacillus simplex]|uniref:DNA integration/recombination/inversion protein n=1 Tax=Peribacillus simplex TaxID=1478 RepID=A0AAN2PF34_9BACI|nr:site-specific integrase [Peribacillus simplex]CEG31417.1 DNA integration/recombination/inversion protein [Peribacillus simplex]
MAHVRKEGKSWYYAIDMGKDSSGKRQIKKKRGFKTEKEAKNALAALMTDINKGNYVEPSKLSYSVYIDDWLKDKKISVKKSTHESYKALIEKHIIPALGDTKLSDITSRQIQSFIRDLFLTEELSDESIQKIYMIVKNSLNSAVKFELLAKNVCEKVERPKVQKKEMKVWDVEEIQHFLKVAEGDHSYMLFHLAVTTGMRMSEILGLRWKNVDLDNGVIYVKEQLERYSHNFTNVKTKASNRNISISETTVQALRKQRKMILQEKLMSSSEEYKDLNLVCPTSVGTPYLPSNLSKIFKRLTKTSGNKPIRFHDLRHSFATMLLSQSVNPKIVSEILGHSSSKITLDVYTHILPNMQKDTAKQLGNMLFGAKTKTN